jgi:hypothetical protein
MDMCMIVVTSLRKLRTNLTPALLFVVYECGLSEVGVIAEGERFIHATHPGPEHCARALVC